MNFDQRLRRSLRVRFELPPPKMPKPATKQVTPAGDTPFPGSSAQQKAPKPHSGKAVPYGMSDRCQISVVVGHVHCEMTPQDIALALGYRKSSRNNGFSKRLLYTWEQVMEVFVHLKQAASDPQVADPKSVYRKWGPNYRTVEEKHRISNDELILEMSLIKEALRRMEFVKNMRKLADEEFKTRWRVWKSFTNREDEDWDTEDKDDMLWDGLAHWVSPRSSGLLSLIR